MFDALNRAAEAAKEAKARAEAQAEYAVQQARATANKLDEQARTAAQNLDVNNAMNKINDVMAATPGQLVSEVSQKGLSEALNNGLQSSTKPTVADGTPRNPLNDKFKAAVAPVDDPFDGLNAFGTYPEAPPPPPKDELSEAVAAFLSSTGGSASAAPPPPALRRARRSQARRRRTRRRWSASERRRWRPATSLRVERRRSSPR